MIDRICCANCDSFGIDIRNGKAVCCCSNGRLSGQYIVDVEHDFCYRFSNADYIVVTEDED